MSELTEFRKAKDHFMAHEHHSPLTEKQQRTFSGLSYYDETPALRFVKQVRLFDDQEVVEMQTSTGDVTTFVRLGKAEFEVEGEVAELTLFKDVEGDGLFLPFADATSGTETYAAGRYLDLTALSDGEVVLDFNYAYNPNCVYNHDWSCPLTPFENRLRVPIRAGERNFGEGPV